ncbi:MAG TPA: ABC transporter ATP-binding protein [Roseiflexaceae bacterium]|nr:ABC transporter ATP-binding protein [Roseiflexaceae bacterium]
MYLPLTQYRSLLGTYLKPQVVRVALLAALLFGGIALQLANPQIIRYFIDTTQNGGPQSALIAAAALFLAVALVQRIITIATTYVGENVGWKATNALRADLALHCLRLDMQFHQRRTPGELIERIDGDVTALANFFSRFVVEVLGNLLLILGILILLFREDWLVGVGLTIYALLTLVALLALQRLAVAGWAGLSQAEAEQAGFLEERLSGTEDIRANGAEPYVLRRLYQLMRTRLQRARAAFLANELNSSVTRLLYAIGYSVGLVIGVYLYSQNQITIGTVYLIVTYIGTLSKPLEALKHEIGDLQKATAGIGRIEELFATDPNIHEHPRTDVPPGPLSVAFDGVSFGYAESVVIRQSSVADSIQEVSPGNGEPLTADVQATTDNGQRTADSRVLHDIAFRLEPGKVLGVLGRTGSGKTTLTRLLFRLYDPAAGAIRLGDVDIRDVSLQNLRGRVGVVTQDVQLFQASVRNNLTLFNPHIPDQAILSVLREIGPWEWFQSLPDGLDTLLGAGGSGLSAGQAQLLAFTRVFLKDPGLVILDEASSRLDPATERLLERAIDRLFQNRSGIVIAHRLGTIQRADNILILDNGHIAEYGPRAALAADPESRFAQLLRTGLEEVLA